MSSPPNKKMKQNSQVKYNPLDFTDPNSPHDRVLIVGDQKFYVYAGLLSSWSEYFNALFTSDFSEKDKKEIELKELESEEFHDFLKALRPNSASVITVDNYLNLMSCARRFLASEVMLLVQNFIQANFDKLDKIDLLEAAFEYDDIELKNRLSDLIASSVTKGNCCNRCEIYGIHCGYCSHRFNGFFLTNPSFLIENAEKFAQLSDEIKAFILQTMMKKYKASVP